MAEKFGALVGAVDQGTSSTRFLIFAANSGELVTHHQVEIPRTAPKEGWVEQDASHLLNSTLECMEGAVKKLIGLGLSPSQVKAVGLTNQRETVVAWDKTTGEALYQAIVWLDSRAAPEVTAISEDPSKKETVEKIRALCGLPLSSYFTAWKIKWMMENVAKVKNAVDANRCIFGTVDTWLLWNMTGGPAGGVHLTDVTNASRTMLMNVHTLQWDLFLCEFFKIPKNLLPGIRSSSEIYGKLTLTPLAGIPISGILGDQQSALVGQLCFEPGQLKCTYGTACTTLLNTGGKIINSKHGLFTTVGYQLGPNSPVVYALEGLIGCGGATIKWLRDNMGLAGSYQELTNFFKSVTDSGGVHFVPAFSGLMAPHWRPEARGIICGLTEYSTKAHIVRAGYEAVVFQATDIMTAMAQDVAGQISITSLRVDGGMTVLDEFMQLQSDMTGLEILRPKMTEATALGAAIAAGAAAGINVWDIGTDTRPKSPAVFSPKIGKKEREERYMKWKIAVKKSFGMENGM